MKRTKKIVAMLLVLLLGISSLVACGKTEEPAAEAPAETPAATETPAAPATPAPAETAFSGPINVVSREDGSGTRGAFIELFGIEEKNAAGEKVDNTTLSAMITNSTAVMLTTVAQDEAAIGYVSLGALDASVKALQIDGADATVENIKAGSYAISRPFNIVTKEGLSEVAQDFVDFILSSDGQAVIEDNGYISASDAGAYEGSQPSGTVVVAGSSSVTPVMEKLQEAYLAVNPNAKIEVQQSDSSTGVSYAIEGTCDIGMASRELKDEETSQGVAATVIAIDGIAVIANLNNPTAGLTAQQVKDIYVGTTTDWADVQ